MAGNLLKGGYFIVANDNKVVIDNNETINKKLQELNQQIKEDAVPELSDDDGFVEGIDPVQVALLVGDGDEVGEDEAFAGRILGGESEPAPDLSAVNAEAEDIISNANSMAEEIKATAQAEGYDAGYNEGLEKGMQEAEDRIQAEISKARSAADQEIANIRAEYDQMSQSLEPMLVEKITDIFQHVIGIECEDKKEIILHILRKSLEDMDSGKHYLIHVSREDYEEVNSSKEVISKGCGIPAEDLDIIEDNSVPKNGCLIESDGGIFDCGLGTQMSLLSKQLKQLSYR